MAIYQCLLLCVGLLAGLAACNGVTFGRCNETHFLTKAIGCEVKFFKALASGDSVDNCSTLYKVQIEQCYNTTLVKCYRGSMDGWQNYVNIGLLSLEAFGHAQYYCSDEEIFVVNLPDHIRKTFPCAIEEYNKGARDCTRAFRHMLAMNRSDPLLCSEYERTTICTARLNKQHCTQEVALLPKGLNIENPFCPAKEEVPTSQVPITHSPRPQVPTTRAPRPQGPRDVHVAITTEQRTTSAARAIVSKSLLWMVVAVICFL